MANLPITNVINITAATAQQGVNAFNTSNMAIFTDDQPQQAVVTISFSDVAASGNFEIAFGGNATASTAWNATLATIQANIMAVTGMANAVVSGSIASKSLVISWPGVLGPIPAVTFPANSLENGSSAAITLSAAVTNAGWSGGASGYSIYLSPTQAQLDFGSTSKTAQMVTSMFSQQPNMLAGNGSVIVIPFAICIQKLTLSGVPASGNFELTYGAGTTSSLAWNATPAQIQTALQALAGLGQVQVVGTLANEAVYIYMWGVYGASPTAIGSTSVTLETSGSSSITITQSYQATGESWGTAVTRTQALVSYLGNCVNELADTIGQTDILAAAAIIQALNYSCLGFVVSNNSTDVANGGMASLVTGASDVTMRFLYYGDSTTVNGIAGINALLFMASYCGLALSTNFNGSNTTQTMHLKSLSTVNADPTMTQVILNNCVTNGADSYPSIQGVPKVFCSGANNFYDQVYNLCWLVTALQVAGFNYLAQSSTKVPQTEAGMDGLKAAYRSVCEQGVSNQYLAPGTWTSSTTFGNQQQFFNNILQRGYYIYSSPVAQQLASARAARQAPLVQIAAKQAGAIQSSTVIVYVNA